MTTLPHLPLAESILDTVAAEKEAHEEQAIAQKIQSLAGQFLSALHRTLGMPDVTAVGAPCLLTPDTVRTISCHEVDAEFEDLTMRKLIAEGYAMQAGFPRDREYHAWIRDEHGKRINNGPDSTAELIDWFMSEQAKNICDHSGGNIDQSCILLQLVRTPEGRKGCTILSLMRGTSFDVREKLEHPRPRRDADGSLRGIHLWTLKELVRSNAGLGAILHSGGTAAVLEYGKDIQYRESSPQWNGTLFECSLVNESV